MNIKIEPKTILAFIGLFGGGVAVGAVAYKKRKDFRDLIDNKIYPGLKAFVKDNGLAVSKVLIETAFVKDSKASKFFLSVIDSIEKGDMKLPRGIEKDYYDDIDEIQSEMEKIEEKVLSNNEYSLQK